MGRLIVSVSHHTVALIDGVIHDTHDPSRNGALCLWLLVFSAIGIGQ